MFVCRTYVVAGGRPRASTFVREVIDLTEGGSIPRQEAVPPMFCRGHIDLTVDEASSSNNRDTSPVETVETKIDQGPSQGEVLPMTADEFFEMLEDNSTEAAVAAENRAPLERTWPALTDNEINELIERRSSELGKF